MALSCAALISATPAPDVPGEGILCLSILIYFAEQTAVRCRAGEDPEYQERLADYARRIDGYIIRNTDGDPSTLARFKREQGLNGEPQPSYCNDDDAAANYDNFKAANANELDRAIDEGLARDGTPTFGDCL